MRNDGTKPRTPSRSAECLLLLSARTAEKLANLFLRSFFVGFAVLLGSPCLADADRAAASVNAEDATAGDSAAGDSVDVTLSPERGLEMSAFDEAFTFRLGGRLIVDGAHYFKDKNDLGSGFEARNARLEVDGTLFSDWEYALSMDFADLDVDVKDMYIGYRGFRSVHLTAGQVREPFSLEALTSGKYITYMELGLPSEFVPGRNVGLAASGSGNWWTASAGAFFGNISDEFVYRADEGWGVTGRLTAVPIQHAGTRLLHIGASASFRDPDSEDSVTFKRRPESHVTDVTLVNTGLIKNIDTMFRFGIETAWVAGPLSLQAEYMRASVDRESAFERLYFDGWYASASWFVTGESRNYLVDEGVFGEISPSHRYGAVELAARFSIIDLNNATITGGEERDVTFGVNWYVNSQVRLMTNFIYAWGDAHADDNGKANGDDHPKILQGRLQMAF
jgi:phosphate-selective porin OprO/OprP